ncbi:hypothetical protein [Dyadobacter tibetensis]|uniref:hypothetical protein n=1 Tax=Dyadobacter tibetensis TaxID=1211851 RepID=UPI00046E7921|nr:hypothetical protein [Dyadobacter tibetensis]
MTKTLIQTRSNRLQDSIDYYLRLGFEVIADSSPTIVSDGKAFIEISESPYVRPGLIIYKSDFISIVSELNKLTNVQNHTDGHLITDGSGTWIYLTEKEFECDLQAKAESTSLLGNYMGICIETIDLSKSAKIFEILGFKQSTPEWPSFSDENGFTITLFEPYNCPHLFFNPSLTYFNGKENLKVIEKIRTLNIPITEEITHFNEQGIVDNIVLRDPSGLGFLVFND